MPDHERNTTALRRALDAVEMGQSLEEVNILLMVLTAESNEVMGALAINEAFQAQSVEHLESALNTSLVLEGEAWFKGLLNPIFRP